MNIDAHAHLVGEGWLHEDFLCNVARIFMARDRDEQGDVPHLATAVHGMKEAFFDTTGEKLVTQMDAAGVDCSAVFALDYGLLTGEAGVPIATQNQLVAQAVQRFPDRLMGFFTIDPRRVDALALFRRAVESWGLRGLKLHPASGWYPYDHVAYPLYEQCRDYQLPMLIHTGGQPAPLKSRFGRPVYVDDVAADFPDLSIIMAHCGNRWWEEALLVCEMKPNCHVDVSGWQPAFIANPRGFYARLRRLIDTIGAWRVLFASDSPYFHGLCPLKDWARAFRHPHVCSDESSFTEEEIDIIMGRAFDRLMRQAT